MRTFLYLSAGIALLAAASCSQDNQLKPVNDEAMTRFTIAIPEEFNTRYGDALLPKKIYVAIYDTEVENSDPVLTNFSGTPNCPDLVITQDFNEGLTAVVDAKLVRNHKYDLVFWAQSDAFAAPEAEGAEYQFNASNRTMTIHYGTDNTIPAYAEERDAFFAIENGYNTGTTSNRTISLKRPFAQINIGTDDIKQYIKTTDATLPKFGMTITGVANVLDMTTGYPAEGNTLTINVEEAVTSTETSTEGEVVNPFEAGVNMDYLAMAYVLVGTYSQPKASLTVSLNVDDNLPFYTYNYIPARMNYRTNIYGSLLTYRENFIVNILPSFGENDDQIFDEPQ